MVNQAFRRADLHTITETLSSSVVHYRLKKYLAHWRTAQKKLTSFDVYLAIISSGSENTTFAPSIETTMAYGSYYLPAGACLSSIAAILSCIRFMPSSTP